MFLCDGWILALTAIPVLFVLLYRYFTRNYDYWKKRGIKSPKAYPLIGNFAIPFTSMPLLHKEYAKKFGNVFGVFQGQTPILKVLDPALIKRIMVEDFAKFRNRPGVKETHKIGAQNLFSSRGEQWKRIRSILTPMFSNTKLRKVEPLMNSCVDALTNALDQTIKTSGVLAVHDTMGNFTMDVIAKSAFATDTNAHVDPNNYFVKIARQTFKLNVLRFMLIAVLPGPVLAFLLRIKFPFIYQPHADFLLDTSKHILKERKRTGVKHNDVLQLMIQAEHNEELAVDSDDKYDSHHVNTGEEELEVEKREFSSIIGRKYLTEEEILAQCLVFFLAGYETTASTLTFILYELAKNLEAQERLYQEVNALVESGAKLTFEKLTKLEYLDSVIAETLRYHPPALNLIREAGDEYRIEEYDLTIEKGQQISIPVYSIHHNEQFYENPDKWEPERFLPENRHKIIPYTYLPFGGGPRNCIGMRFAMNEMKLGLANLVHKFEFFPTDKSPSKLTPGGLVVMKTETIYVGVRRRQAKTNL